MKESTRKYGLLIGAPLALAFMLIAGRYFLYDFTAQQIGSILFEIVQLNDNNSPYDYSNHKISFYPFEKQLKIEGLEVKPKIASEDSMKTQYSLILPEFFIDLNSITDIYFKKKLSITGISLASPQIKVIKNGIKDEEEKKKPIPVQANDLYKQISIYLKKLDVGEFSLKNGSVQFIQDSVEKFKIENFSLDVTNFSLDSSNIRSKGNVMYTEKVLLQISNQSFELNDKNHRAHFDSLVFSSSDSTFRVFNFRFRNISHPDKQDSVNIPLISFNNIDFNAFYRKKIIDLGNITLESPYIHIHPPGTVEEKKDKEPALNLLSYQVVVDSISINKGSFSYLDSKRTIKAEEVNLHHGLYVIEPNGEIFNLKEFVRNISLSGSSLKVIAPGLRFTADRTNLEGKTEDFELFNLDLEFVNENSDLILKGPYARIKSYDISDSFVKVDSAWVRDLAVNASVKKLINNSTKSKYHFGVDYLNLASTNIDAIIDTIQLDIDDLNVMGYRICDTLGQKNINRIKFVAGVFDYETPNNKATINNWSYNGQTNNLSTSRISTKYGNINSLKLFNPLLLKLKEKHYQFDSLEIANADLVFYQKKNQGSANTSDIIKSLIYDKVRIKDSRIRVRDQKQNIDLGRVNFEMDENMLMKKLSLSYFNLDSDSLSFSTGGGIYQDSLRSFTVKKVKIDNNRNLNFNLDSISLVGLSDSIFLKSPDSLLSKIGKVIAFRPYLKLIAENNNKQKRTLPFAGLPAIEILNGELEIINRKKKSSVVVGSIDASIPSGIDSLNYWQKAKESNFKLSNISVSMPDNVFRLNTVDYENEYLNLLRISGEINNNIDLNIDSISIARPDFASFTENGRLKMESILGSGIIIEIDSLKQNKKPAKGGNQNFKGIDIAFSRFRDVNISFDLTDQKVNLKDLDIDLQNINWNKGDSLVTFLDNALVSVSGPELKYRWFKQRRDFSSKQFRYDDVNKKFILEDLVSSPFISKDSFMIDQPFETDYIDISTNSITINDFDIRDVIFNKKIASSKIDIQGFDISVFRDKRLPDPVGYKSLPHTKITKSPFELSIDTIFINTKKILYTERNEVSDTISTLYFTNINSYIFRLYSDEEKIMANKPMRLFATGDIMDDGFFETTVDFVTTDTSGNYSMKGTIGTMDLTQLNPILEHSAQISVVSGKNELIDFNFKANNQYALGEMKFYYEDLKITVFNRDNQPKGLAAGFKTFFANTFVVNKNNPHFLFVREGDIYFERAEERSIINYWAKSLLSGVVTSIGARNNKKEIRQLNERSKSKLERKENAD